MHRVDAREPFDQAQRTGVPEPGDAGRRQGSAADLDEEVVELDAVPHDPDVKALLRLAQVWNIPVANNRATADFLISSPLMGEEYLRKVAVYERNLDDLDLDGD